MQMYIAVGSVPWTLKPILGMISDIQPIGGFHKAPYIAVTSVLGSCAFFVVGVMQSDDLAVSALVVSTFLIALQIVTADILVQGKFSEKVRTMSSGGDKLIGFVWVGVYAGALLGTLSSGFIIHFVSYRMCYILSAIPATIVLLVVMQGYLEEKQVTSDEAAANRGCFYQQRQMCSIVLFMAAGSLSVVAVALLGDDVKATGVSCICIMATVVSMFWLFLNPKIASVNMFIALQVSLSVNIDSSVFYFFTDGVEEYPEGPHFSDFFFNTVLGSVSAIAFIAGMILYYRLSRGWTYRQWLMMANCAYATVQALNIIIYKRKVHMLGFSDEVFVLLCAAITKLVDSWRWLPAFSAFTYLCPKGMEATMYGLLMGCHNLAGNCALNIGAWLLNYIGCRPAGKANEQGEFDSLWKASMLTSMLIYMVVTFCWLLPNEPQDVSLLSDDDTATSGCLLERWSKVS
eukprot:gnl/TRDRNA2_/TRDRNA2_85908_c0_seq1.p1 gnl/TRDRNA2_/TRDRNA2_85908_c0~~gnl/TRDRNA2_/TRDRNA2_85908_c0_seq1.p1  ORF type:complete len:459 (+),score=51.75 gnl/TRDRNA2_/TRDRNA2_85908_c0_seq1:327-1703(+)